MKREQLTLSIQLICFFVFLLGNISCGSSSRRPYYPPAPLGGVGSGSVRPHGAPAVHLLPKALPPMERLDVQVVMHANTNINLRQYSGDGMVSGNIEFRGDRFDCIHGGFNCPARFRNGSIAVHNCNVNNMPLSFIISVEQGGETLETYSATAWVTSDPPSPFMCNRHNGGYPPQHRGPYSRPY